MVARVVPQSARRRHAESRKPDLWGWAARPKAPALPAQGRKCIHQLPQSTAGTHSRPGGTILQLRHGLAAGQ